MRSATDIANMALSLLGDIEITNIDQPNSTPARLCRKFYDMSVDSLAELHDWSFLLKISKLQLIKKLDGGHEFTYEYSMPTNFLRMVSIGDRTFSYEIIGSSFFTNKEDVEMLYVSSTHDPNLFSNIFTKAISYYLASTLALPLKADIKISDYLETKAMNYTKQAITIDNQTLNRVKLLVNGATQARDFGGLWIGYNEPINPFNTREV